MKILEIFDPAMCCSTGICGPSIDQRLVKLAADIEFLRSKGIMVKRYNLAHQPEAFTNNPLVLAEMGSEAENLPMFLVDGKICAQGIYPNRSELASWLGIEVGLTALKVTTTPCCDPESGCC
jgi:hypothetical protein